MRVRSAFCPSSPHYLNFELSLAVSRDCHKDASYRYRCGPTGPSEFFRHSCPSRALISRSFVRSTETHCLISTGGDSNRTTAIILLKTPYAIGFVVALFLHLLLPEDKEEEEEEESSKEMKVDPVLSSAEA